MEWDESQEFPVHVFKEMGKLGLMGVLVPEEYGGAGLGYFEYKTVIEEISKVCGSIGLSLAAHNSLCTGHILNFGNEEQKKRWLPKLATAEWIGAWGLTEANTGSDAGNMRCTATKEGNDWIINGTKNWITHGKSGDIAVEIALKDPDNASDVKKEINNILGKNYLVQDKYQQNQSLYSVMNMERWIIYGVLCLILVVAAFNMIGALTMLALEKQKDILVLQALGGHRSFIRKIFISEGLLLAFIGGIVGMLLALIIAVLQIKFHLIPLAGGSFLIDYFPVKLRVWDFVLVGATVFVIALIAAWLPSNKAAGQDFSLRSE